MSLAHLHRYVKEFAGRHNVRSLDTAEQMRSLARGACRKCITYQRLITHPELGPSTSQVQPTDSAYQEVKA